MFIQIQNTILNIQHIGLIRTYDFVDEEEKLWADSFELILFIDGEKHVFSYEEKEDRDNVYQQLLKIIKNNGIIEEIKPIKEKGK